MATFASSPQPSLRRLSLMQSTTTPSPTGSTFSTESSSATRGPRPLQLLNGPRSPGPSTAPLHTRSNSVFPLSPSEQSPSARRLHTPRRQSSISYSPRPRDRDQHLRSSLPLGLASPVSAKENQDKVVPRPLDSPRGERPPLTLAERHADLLHFIAQKESKCLELRSQLAIHEAELLNLKRKWERIVSRGVDGTVLPESVASTTAGAQGVVLDGIKEGVQGVGRFIAGLSDLAAPPPPSSALQPRIERLAKGRADRESTSSASTYTTTTTRLSHSSSSSIDGADGEDDYQQSFLDEDTVTMDAISPVVLQQTPKLKVNSGPTVVGEPADSQPSQMSRAQSNASAVTASPITDSSTPSTFMQQNRPNISSSGLPPPSSIPGLSAFSNTTAVPPLSSWVGSVGKKWGELQKTQKRASVILTDVSQSFFAAIASPPLSSTALPNSPLGTTLRPSLSSSGSRTSLLDDDDDENGLGGAATQWLSNVAALTPDRVPSQVANSKVPALADKKSHAPIEEEEEEDWNW